MRTPIAIVPLIIDEREIITLAEPSCPAPPDYVFYTINAWTCRKAIWNTVCAYCETFTAHDAVTLIIKTTKKDLTRKLFGRYLYNSRAALRKLLREYDAAPKIEMITDELSSEEILKLHARGDCYVSLCRSEGWGMGAFDAARFGRPVIITGYGGQLDYLSRELSYLVDYRESPVDDKLNERSYSQDQRWAAPDLLQAGRLMREVYQARESAQARASRLQQQILTRFNRAAVTAQMKDVLNT